jgi:hypothetical protein
VPAAVISDTDNTSVYTFGTPHPSSPGGPYAGSAGDGEVSRDYLKFTLPSATANSYISSAVLELNYRFPYLDASFPLSVFASTDAWTQAGITWTNQPGLGASLATFTPTTQDTIISIDVTSYVNSQYLGDGVASLIVAAQTEYFSVGPNGSSPNSWYYFRSDIPEQLSFTISQSDASAAPEPSTFVIFGTAIASTAGYRAWRRRKRSAA